jgi:hypothetical protein
MVGNILVIANWLAEKGIPEKANWIQENFLTGTAIAVITREDSLSDYFQCNCPRRTEHFQP